MERHSRRPPAPGKRIALLACMLAWHAAVAASDVLPVHLTGTWGTAASLHEGDAGQSQLHLDADGYGVMVGSTPRPTRIDGKDHEGPQVRAVIGFPLRATLDGTTLTARVVALDPKDAEKARRIEITCRHEATSPTLTCRGPGREPVVMRRFSETVPAEVARTLEQVRSVVRQDVRPAFSR